MDANDLAQPLYLPDSAAVARRDWEPAPAPHQNVPHGMDELLSMDHMFSEPETHVARNATETHQLAIRAGGKSVPPCVWTLTVSTDFDLQTTADYVLCTDGGGAERCAL